MSQRPGADTTGAAVSGAFHRLQRRRKTALENVVLVVPIATAVLSSGLLVADWTPASSALLTAGTGLALAAGWAWHRHRFPADIDPPAPEQPRERVERHEDAGPIWRWDNLLVVAVGAVLVTSVVVVGVVGAAFLPIVVVVGFGVADGWSDLGAVGTSMLCALATALAVELAVVHPLCRRWGLPLDSPIRDRKDFCPTPDDGPRGR